MSADRERLVFMPASHVFHHAPELGTAQ